MNIFGKTIFKTKKEKELDAAFAYSMGLTMASIEYERNLRDMYKRMGFSEETISKKLDRNR